MICLVACSKTPKAAVLDEPGALPSKLDSEAEPEVGLLSSDQQRAVKATFQNIPPSDFQSSDPPRSAPRRGRWSDVSDAITLAAGQRDVSMILVSSTLESDRWTFRLRTLADIPVVLFVTRAEGKRVYEAAAQVGFLGSYRREESTLLRAFETSMSNLGKKRSFKN